MLKLNQRHFNGNENDAKCGMKIEINNTMGTISHCICSPQNPHGVSETKRDL